MHNAAEANVITLCGWGKLLEKGRSDSRRSDAYRAAFCVRDFCMADESNSRLLRDGVRSIPAPFHDVAEHVIKSPRIWLFLLDRVSLSLAVPTVLRRATGPQSRAEVHSAFQ